MPTKKSKAKEKPSDTATSAALAISGRYYPTVTTNPPSAMLAAPSRPPLDPGLAPFITSRPTLPPLSHLQTSSTSQDPLLPHQPSLGSYRQPPHHGLHGTYPSSEFRHALPRLSTDSRGYGSNPGRYSPAEYRMHNTPQPMDQGQASPRSHNPLKRGADYSDVAVERPLPFSAPAATHLAYTQMDPSDQRFFPTSRSVSTTSTPTTASYPTFGQPTFSSHQSTTSSRSQSSRCTLHMRQQPRAARAGPDGKDRRPIDPPPVLQLLMNDFDPDNPSDLEEIQNPYYVVHCRLVSAHSPRRDVSTLASTTEDGSKEIQRLLLGTAVASPHHTRDDPDADTMPTHPVSDEPLDPPSPSSRFLPSSATTKKRKGPPRTAKNMPCTFFIFADISVRKAGEYRLEFSLMKVEPHMLMPGGSMPIIHSVASQIFKVVNAKDFDQVQPSTKLVRGLIERGAGFPLKLKKGTREGQRGTGRERGSEGGDSQGEKMDLSEGEDDE